MHYALHKNGCFQAVVAAAQADGLTLVAARRAAQAITHMAKLRVNSAAGEAAWHPLQGAHVEMDRIAQHQLAFRCNTNPVKYCSQPDCVAGMYSTPTSNYSIIRKTLLRTACTHAGRELPLAGARTAVRMGRDITAWQEIAAVSAAACQGVWQTNDSDGRSAAHVSVCVVYENSPSMVSGVEAEGKC